MFMVGDSAGAQLVSQCLTILTNRKFAQLYSFDIPEDFRVKACALNCGVYYLGVNRFFKPSEKSMMRAYLPDDYLPYMEQLKVSKYVTKDFPPAFVMTAYNDFLKFMAKPFYRRLKRAGVECDYHCYGSREQKEIGHVFHVNCRSEVADICNDDECAFFRRFSDNE